MAKSKDTEGRILDAARRVFVKKGLSGARMQEIADEAGINKALLHYYFRSKEKLFDRIFEEVFQSISMGIGKAMKAELPPLEKLEQLISMYVDILSKNPYMPIFILNEISQNPERMKKALGEDIFPSMTGFFTELMQEMNVGNMRPIHPAHLLMNIMGMIILPIAGKPMLSPVLKESLGIDFDDILAERKQVITDFVFNALKIDEHGK